MAAQRASACPPTAELGQRLAALSRVGPVPTHQRERSTLPRTTVVAAALLAMSLAVAPIASPAENTTQGKQCTPAGSRTLAQNDHVRVFRSPAPGTLRGLQVFACAYAQGDRVPLDDGDQSFTFLPPAISLRGTLVGYASVSCDFSGGGNGCQTGVFVDDLSRPLGQTRLTRANAGPNRFPAVKVGSLRVKSNGALAWITCPEPLASNSETQIVGDRGPTCVRAGSLDRVYKLDAGARKRTLLDRGRRIQPSSLRLAGSQLSWRADGRLRRAHLK